MDLSKLREELDRIDGQIVKLYEERMEYCSQVADYKIRDGQERAGQGQRRREAAQSAVACAQ